MIYAWKIADFALPLSIGSGSNLCLRRSATQYPT
jgi:hypothetical protein